MRSENRCLERRRRVAGSRARLWAVGAIACAVACAGTPEPAPKTGAEAGQELFLKYCAACHGANAEGHGPAAAALRTKPPDLTRLGEKYGRPLPEAKIAEFIDGRAPVTAHGRADMPVWGEKLYGAVPPHGMTESNRRNTIHLIVEYLESIQRAD